jgi:hypothetical protein
VRERFLPVPGLIILPRFPKSTFDSQKASENEFTIWGSIEAIATVIHQNLFSDFNPPPNPRTFPLVRQRAPRRRRAPDNTWIAGSRSAASVEKRGRLKTEMMGKAL